MRVLQITNNYPTKLHPIFGVFVKEQIESLTDLGVESDVYFINGYEKGKLEYLKNVPKLRKVVKEGNYDIIHCHHALAALTFILTGLSSKNKMIVSFQNDPVHEHGLFLYKILLKHSKFRIFKNNSNLILDESSFYLPNGVDTEFFKPIDRKLACEKIGLDPSNKYILFVSSFLIRKQKRLDRYKEVMNILRESYPEYKFHELIMVNEKRDVIPYYFNAASVHLLTSDFEGSPNSVKECVSCNTPVVSTNVGNVAEMLKGAVNCFISYDSSPTELAEFCIKAINSNADIRNLIFEKELDKLSIAKRLTGIYKLLQSKPL